MWGSQHSSIPPYGTTLPYPTLYPDAGPYTQSIIDMAQGAAPTNSNMEGRISDGKNKASSNKSRRSLGNTSLIVRKSGESGKANSGSGNDGVPQSVESVSEDSSDASDENAKQHFITSRKHSGENAQNNNSAEYGGEKIPVLVQGKPVVPISATNLKIGMDLWIASSGGTALSMKMRPNALGVSTAVAPATAVGSKHQSIQDEQELKRQKRKQSNRESARRSRLRKQAECEELQTTVEKLNSENRFLTDGLRSLAEECEKLASENKSITENMTQLYGSHAVSDLVAEYPCPVL